MLDVLGPISSDRMGGAESGIWPDEDTPWVTEARKHAPGLDSLLRWAFENEASRVAFATGHPVWVRVHGRNRPVTRASLDEAQIAQIANHLYGADGTARLQSGSDFDVSYDIPVSRSKRLRFRLNATPIRTSGVVAWTRPVASWTGAA